MTRTGDTTSGSPVVTSVAADTTGLLAGMEVTGAGIPAGTTILSVDDASTITLSQNAEATATGVTLTIFTILAASPSATATATASLVLGNSTLATAVDATATGTANISAIIGLAGAGDVSATGSVTVSSEAQLAAAAQASGAAAVGSLVLDMRITAAAQVSATGTGAVQDSSVNLSASVNATALGAANATHLHNLAADALASAAGTGQLSYVLVLHAEATASATASVQLGLVGTGLGVCDAINDILLLWGIEDARLAVEYLRERALADLNAAMQVIWSQAKDRDYFSRRTLTLPLSTGTGSTELEQEVQAVLGPVRRASDKVSLRPLASRSQLDSFGHVFLGRTSAAIENGTPQAFFAERLTQGRPDTTRIVLHVTPPPDEDLSILVDVAMECPRYEWRDYCQCTPLSIPHRYAESVLLPVCRFRAMSSQYFVKPERRPMIENEYAMAMRVLGLVDPQLAEVTASRKQEAPR